MDGWKKKVLIGVLIADGLAVNAAAGYMVYKYEIRSRDIQKTSFDTQIDTRTAAESDTEGTISELGAKISTLEGKLNMLLSAGVSGTPVPTIKPAVKTQPAVPTRIKTRQVQYVTIPGSGSTQANSWADLPGTEFYFDPGDYQGLVEVYLEVNMKLFNGNGMAYARLLDVTHGIGVQGSDVRTSSQADTVVTSGKVSFWAGKNLIRVQGMSLTADTAVYNSGRLRIVTEN